MDLCTKSQSQAPSPSPSTVPKPNGDLNESCCCKIINSFEISEYFQSADCKTVAEKARTNNDFNDEEVFSRILRLLQYVSARFWEEKKSQINSTVRIRQLLFRADIVSVFKKQINEILERKILAKAWEVAGKTFI